MSNFHDDWMWVCPGCASKTRLTMDIAQRELDREYNPARHIASERLKLERGAAQLHAGVCKRPV